MPSMTLFVVSYKEGVRVHLLYKESSKLPAGVFWHDHEGFLPPSPKPMKTTEKQIYINNQNLAPGDLPPPVQWPPPPSKQPKAIPPLNSTPNTTFLTLQPVNNPPKNHHISASDR